MAPQREWYTTDYYKTLGVSDKATDKELRRAYRKLAKQFHPDSNPGSEERFKEISAAYDVLGDPEKRKEYDEVRRLGPLSGLGGFGGGSGTPGNGNFNFRVEDLSDIFGGLFGRGGRGGGRGTPGSGPRRGHDLEAELHLSFQEAVDGAVTTVNVTSGMRCATCGGSGSRPGTVPVVCPRCNGLGVLNDNQGHVLAVLAVPGVPGTRDQDRRSLPDVPRLGPRAAPTPGQGPHPRRRRGRPANPGEGPRRAGGQWRTCR